MRSARYQPGEVRHVHQQIGAHFIGDLPHAREIKLPRIRRTATDDHLRLLFNRLRLERVVIDCLGVLTHLVSGNLV